MRGRIKRGGVVPITQMFPNSVESGKTFNWTVGVNPAPVPGGDDVLFSCNPAGGIVGLSPCADGESGGIRIFKSDIETHVFRAGSPGQVLLTVSTPDCEVGLTGTMMVRPSVPEGRARQQSRRPSGKVPGRAGKTAVKTAAPKAPSKKQDVKAAKPSAAKRKVAQPKADRRES